VTLVAEPLAMPGLAGLLRADHVVLADGGRVALWQAGLTASTAELVLLIPAGGEIDPTFTRRALQALDEEFDYATAVAARGRRPWHSPLGGEAVAATGFDAGASVAVVRRAALRPDAASERELWSGLAGVVIQEPLVTRLPRRSADAAEPRDQGAPEPSSVAAAFGDILTCDQAIESAAGGRECDGTDQGTAGPQHDIAAG
jgi:hypothetical protein